MGNADEVSERQDGGSPASADPGTPSGFSNEADGLAAQAVASAGSGSDLGASEHLTRREDTQDATRREDPLQPTRREDATGATRRETSSAPGDTTGEDGQRRLRVNPPPELEARGYHDFEDLEHRGNEADLLKLTAPDGTVQVLKLYRSRNVRMEPELEQAIRSVDPTHVPRLLGSGRSGDLPWELLEYIEGGTLDEIIRDSPRPLSDELAIAVTRELWSAITALHDRSLVHRDIKPSNILVRHRDPLDLVLADFGLVRILDTEVEMGTVAGTWIYAPPEATAGQVSTAWDWWSLGIVVFELLAGRNPWGAPISEAHARARLVTSEIPFEEVPDGRWRLLCQGLLTREPEHRWTGVQVAEWLDGGSPAVHTAATAVPPFVFADTEHGSPRALATTMVGHWSQAARLLSNESEVEALHDWLIRVGASPSTLAVLGAEDRPRSPDARVIQFVYDVDPTLPRIFRDYAIDGHGLSDLCSGASRDGAPEALRTAVTALFEHRLLTLYPDTRSGHGLDVIDDAWRADVVALDELIDHAIPSRYTGISEPVRSRAIAELLLTRVDRRHSRRLDDAARASLERAQGVDWFRELGRTRTANADVRNMAIAIFAPVAVEEQRELGSVPTNLVLEVSPSEVLEGEPVHLRWHIANVEAVDIDGLGRVGNEGDRMIPVYSSRAFHVEARFRGERYSWTSPWVTVIPRGLIRSVEIPVPRENVTLRLDRSFTSLARLPEPFSTVPDLREVKLPRPSLPAEPLPSRRLPPLPELRTLVLRVPRLLRSGRNRGERSTSDEPR